MNHKVIVSRVERVEPIPGADRIQVGFVLGERVIISKDIQPGYVGLLFPTEVQLSVPFCHYNNLFRDAEKNADTTKKGFFDDNRKVRAQPFLGVKSEGYFTSIESLNYLGEGAKADIEALKVGDAFDSLNGNMICQKYYSEKTKQVQKEKRKNVSDKPKTPLFHEHVDTEQFKYAVGKIPVGALLTFHSKFHGSSGRYTKTLVKRKPVGVRSILNRVLLAITRGRFKLFADTETYEHVAGTRRVVLYRGQENKISFHGKEQWRFDWLDKLAPHLEDGVTVYGEIYGYANGKPIMSVHKTAALGKNNEYTKKYGEDIVYKYGCPEGTNGFMVYRITYTTAAGLELDFSVEQIKRWCQTRGFEHTLEVHPPMFYDGDEDKLRSLVEELTERPDVLTEDYVDASHISEGIIIRVDHGGATPTFLKAKSVAFKICEGLATIDEIDLEDAS